MSTLTQIISPSNILTSTADNSYTGKQSYIGTSSKVAVVFNDAAEAVTVSATAATGTINYDVTTQSVLYYTSNASANWTVNFRASSGTSLNTALSTGQSVTVVFMVTQWQNGAAPSAGNASSIDVYSYTIIKTANATFTVFASQVKFA